MIMAKSTNSGTHKGTLFYVMGASGSGKDSIIRYARAHLPTMLPTTNHVLFAHRYITRPAELVGENHIALSEAEFNTRLNAGCFALHWYSNNLSYGIGIEINQWLRNGMNVVINGSRGYLPTAKKHFPNLIPIMIHVPLPILEQRLIARNREDTASIQARLQRAKKYESLRCPNLQTLNNAGLLADTGNAFIAIITQRHTQTTQTQPLACTIDTTP